MKHHGGKRLPRRSSLALALMLGIFSDASAQSTTGSISGTIADATGRTVLIENNSGFSREVALDARGRYSVASLPLGTYRVTVREGGQTVEVRENIAITVGATTDVSFAGGDVQTLGAVSVTGSRVTAIDVASVDTRTVITAQELAVLPIARNAEAIALLAPGVVNNSGAFLGTGGTGGSLPSFGGSAASENAYYLNGFNTTDPYRNLGGLTLPYGAIDQQEIFTGGYGAQYGRSNGGVINQVGRRGSNDWSFGGALIFEPQWLRTREKDLHYSNVGQIANPVAGSLYRPNSENETDRITYSAYAGGPIIKDRLFFFVAGEFSRTDGERLNSVEDTSAPYVDYTFSDPRWYAKLDWYITDNHLLEFTGASDKHKSDGTIYNYNYTDLAKTTVRGADNDIETGHELLSLKYTGYLSDSLTLTALYGEQESPNYNQNPAYNASIPSITGLVNQNPAYTGGTPIGNDQTVATITDPDRRYEKDNLRLNLNWVIGDHSIDFGIDNQELRAFNQGSRTSGPGFAWNYGRTASPLVQLSGASREDGTSGVPGPGNFANGQGGYYVIQTSAYSLSSYKAEQNAWYIEDKWQVTDRLLLSLGIRNDKFANYNDRGQAVIDVDNQWSPRLGFSWDVNGDSSLKVFGNVGRYYLGLPLAPGGLGNSSRNTSTYYTYSGINADGTPVLSVQMAPPVSANENFGNPRDYRTIAPADLEGEHQDEIILGASKLLGSGWLAGVRATHRILQSSIDDTKANIPAIRAAAAAAGITISPQSSASILFNAGDTNTFRILGTDGQLHNLTLTNDQLGFPELKRNYSAVEFTLERPFDGQWYTKLNYVWSHSYGTTEGQMRSDLYRGNGETVGINQGQNFTATTQTWDHPSLMEYYNGDQSNDHRHAFKAYGFYQATPTWGFSGNVSLVSGAPKQVLAYYAGENYPRYDSNGNYLGQNTDPVGYGGSYHFYNGEPAPPGSQGRLPWVRQLDLGVTWKPTFGDGRFAVNLNIFNVTNEQAATYLNARSEIAPGSPHPLFAAPLFYQTPRHARLTLSYDW